MNMRDEVLLNSHLTWMVQSVADILVCRSEASFKTYFKKISFQQNM